MSVSIYSFTIVLQSLDDCHDVPSSPSPQHHLFLLNCVTFPCQKSLLALHHISKRAFRSCIFLIRFSKPLPSPFTGSSSNHRSGAPVPSSYPPPMSYTAAMQTTPWRLSTPQRLHFPPCLCLSGACRASTCQLASCAGCVCQRDTNLDIWEGGLLIKEAPP